MLLRSCRSVGFPLHSTVRFSSRKDYKGTPHEQECLKRGLEYEHHCIRVLKEFSMHCRHKGSAGDKGIDFQGFWQLVPAEKFDHNAKNPFHLYNIIGECKHERVLCRSVYIKELEGVVSRWRHKQHHGSFITNKYADTLIQATQMVPNIGLIVTSSGYSQRAIDAFERSHNPLVISVIRTADWLPKEPTSEHLKSCFVYWKANEVANELLPDLVVNTVESPDTIVPSLRMSWEGIDVATLELPDPGEKEEPVNYFNFN